MVNSSDDDCVADKMHQEVICDEGERRQRTKSCSSSMVVTPSADVIPQAHMLDNTRSLFHWLQWRRHVRVWDGAMPGASRHPLSTLTRRRSAGHRLLLPVSRLAKGSPEEEEEGSIFAEMTEVITAAKDIEMRVKLMSKVNECFNKFFGDKAHTL